MTPSVLAAHERSKRFHAHIARKAAELERMKIAAVEQPLVVASVPKLKPAEADKAPLSWKILRAIAQEFDITVSEMRCTSQHYRYVLPRQIAVGLMVEMTDLSWVKIGTLLGGRDHSTAHHSWRRYQVIASEESIRNRLDQIKADISNG
jgi:chromosomal replication initiation ATPase DnaA